MAITLRQLAYFAALARHRNFGRAAASCHVSQPALSVQIRDLEAHLGAPLVERRAREALLTAFGQSVLPRAEEALRAARAVEEMGRHQSGTVRGLRLGLIPTLAPYLLPGVLARLRAADIGMDLEVQEAKTEALLGRLDDGALDAAVVALPVDGVSAVALFEDRFVLAGAATAVDRLPRGLRPDGLGQGRLLLLEDGHCLADQALEVCGRDRSGDRITMGATSLATLTRLAAEGFGMTLLPESAIPDETRGLSGLALRRFSGSEPGRQVGLVRRRTTPAAPWFDDLAQTLSEVGLGLIRLAREAVPLAD